MPVKTRLDQAVTKFKRYRIAQNVSQSTLRNDSIATQALMRAAGTNLWMENVTNHHVTEAIILLRQTNSPRSVCNYFYALQSFFKYCATVGKCMPRYNDPMEGMKPPKFTVEEKRRLPVQLFPVVLDTAPNPRDRAYFAGALYLLSRDNELADIRIGDLNLSAQRVKVKVSKKRGRKAQSSDLMPITREFDKELREWLLIYQKHCGYLDPTWYLFPRLSRPKWIASPHGGRPMFNANWDFNSSQELRPDMFIDKGYLIANRTLERIKWKAKEEKGEGMHTFRRAGARARFDALRGIGYDGALRQVQALLHHESSSMTEEYIGLTLDRLERDEALMGQDMYPQLNDPEVVNLADFRVDTYDPRSWEADLPGFKVRTA